jgi:hypothetical protein
MSTECIEPPRPPQPASLPVSSHSIGSRSSPLARQCVSQRFVVTNWSTVSQRRADVDRDRLLADREVHRAAHLFLAEAPGGISFSGTGCAASRDKKAGVRESRPAPSRVPGHLASCECEVKLQVELTAVRARHPIDRSSTAWQIARCAISTKP